MSALYPVQNYHNWKWPDGTCVLSVPSVCRVCQLAILLFIWQESLRHPEKPPPKDKATINKISSSNSIMNARGLG